MKVPGSTAICCCPAASLDQACKPQKLPADSIATDVCVGLRQPGCTFYSQLCGHLNTTQVQLSVVLHYVHKRLAFRVASLL
jgi:hypothetical protein